MMTKMVVSVVLLLGLTSQAFAEQYKYTGSSSLANGVCRSVVQDTPAGLHAKLLRHQRSSVILSRSYTRGSALITRDFRCNQQSLREFAVNVGADKVTSYLDSKEHRKGTVTIEEIELAYR